MALAAAAAAGRPPTKKAQRAASTERLMAAAFALFVSRGYQHTSVEQIAERAGLSKGAVYFYFGSKAALLLRLLDRVEEVVVDAMAARVAAAGGDARDRLVAFIHSQARLGIERWEHVLLLILMSLEFKGRGDDIEARLAAIYRRLYRTVEDIIALGRRSGAFRADIARREQAAIVMAAHDGTFLEWYRRADALDGRELVRALRVAMLAALERPAGEGGARSR